MKKWITLSVLAVVLVLGFVVAESAQRPGQGERVIRAFGNVVTGEISGISKKFISVVYNKDEETGVDYEMLIPIDENVQVEHKKGLGEFKKGDTVSVEYEDATVEDSAKQRKMRRKGTLVSFVRSAPPAPPDEEE